MIKGKDIILSVDDKPLAAAKSCKLKLGTKFIEVCSPTDGDVEQYVPTIRSWNVSADMFAAKMEDYDRLYAMWKSKQKLTLRFYDNELQSCYKGDAYIKNIDLAAQVGNHATFACSFQPTGDLSKASSVGIVMRTQGTASTQRVLFWPETGRDYAWVRTNTQTQEQNNEYVMLYEVTFSRATRFTFINRGMVVKASAEDVLSMLVDNDTASLNAAAVLVSNQNPSNRTVVVNPTAANTKCTILMNYPDATSAPSAAYLTKL